MRKGLKWLLIALASFTLVAGIAVAYIAATFDPNDYKSHIIQLVKERTGRTLRLQGDIRLTFYPTLGMKLGEAHLSERNSERPFASLAEAIVAVKLIPLLSKEVVAEAIELKGLRATIVRTKAGGYNFDDLTASDPKKPRDESAPLKIDIDHVTLSDSDVTYIDQAAGTQYRLSKLDLKTGRVAPGVTTPLELSALIASSQHKAQLDTKLSSKVTFDFERQLYKLDGLDFATRGSLGTLSGLTASAKGYVEARVATGEILARDLTVAFSAKQSGAELKAKLDAPKLTLTRDKVEGGKLALDASRTEGGGRLVVKATLGTVGGSFTAMKAAPLDAQIEMQRDGRTTKARIGGALTANVEAQRFEVPDLTLTATVSDTKMPKGSYDAALKGAARADLKRESAALDFSGRIEQSNVNGKAAVTRFEPLKVTFDLNADQLDADRLLGNASADKSSAKQAKGGEPQGRGKEEPIDLSALKGIDAAGTVKIGRLTLLNLKSSQVRADIKVANARLDVAPLSAQLYQGSLKGSLSALAANNPSFTVKQQLTGVDVGPLLRDAADIDTLEAKGNINVDLATHGASTAALKKALSGNAAVRLIDGSLKGIDIGGTIRAARSQLRQLRGEQVQQSNKNQKTDFSELTATFDVKNGVARNKDLAMKSPLLRVAGAGDLDIGNDRINYLLKATVVGTSKGQGGKDATELGGVTVPVKLTGALESPQYAIDFSGMAVDFAKTRLEEELLRRATGKSGASGQPSGGSQSSGDKPRDVLREGIKGIFGGR